MKTFTVLFLSLALASLASSAHAGRYDRKWLDPWIGASMDEVIAKWGYPQHAGDIFKIDPETTIWTYRKAGSSYGNAYGVATPTYCAVSLVFENSVVMQHNRQGENCPRVRRYEPEPWHPEPEHEELTD